MAQGMAVAPLYCETFTQGAIVLEGTVDGGKRTNGREVLKQPTGGVLTEVETRHDGGDAEKTPCSPSIVAARVVA